MSEGKETTNPKPEILQMNLGTLYRNLPLPGVNINERFSEIRLEQEKYDQVLRVLLASADVTPSLKSAIENAFINALTIGTSGDDFPWSSLGLQEPIHPQGIFSPDPTVRRKIEREIYEFEKEELSGYVETQKTEPSAELAYLIKLRSDFLKSMETEFWALYGETINPPAPRG